MKQERKENKAPIIALLVIAIVGVVGGTFAYFTSTTEFENRFQTKPYSTEVSEEFTSPTNWTPGTTTAKTVIAKNTGDIDVAVRVSYTETWKGNAGSGSTLSGNITVGEAPNTTTERAAIINFANTSDWQKEGNYYYYKHKLSKNQQTNSFISGVTFNPNVTASLNCVTDDTTTPGTITETCTSAGNGYDNAQYTLTISVQTIQFDGYQTGWGTSVVIQ